MPSRVLSDIKYSSFLLRHRFYYSNIHDSNDRIIIFLYKVILEEIKQILIINNINLNDIPKRIIIDFEKSLQKAVKLTFPESIIDGCYFHYVKLLWGKAKNLGMFKKINLETTKIILFILKIMPFLKGDDKKVVFSKLEEIFDKKEGEYGKLISYYKKNWLNNEYIYYTEVSNEEYINRTNNYLESFHGHLNDNLQCFHTKLSYLIYKYKKMFDEYI